MTSTPSWEPVQQLRTRERVLTQIQQKILDGSLRPGDKLPSERELMSTLGVSRTSVREALRALEVMGIIQARTGSGRDSGSVVVTGRSTDALVTLLRLHLAVAQISLADLVETRVQLERSAALRAAATRTPADLEHLTQLVEAMKSTELEYQQYNALDTEFHVTIAKISGNELAADIMQALRGAVETQMTAAFAQFPDWRSVADALVTEHDNVLRAIEKGDGDAAAELVTEHIMRFYQDRLLNN